MSSLDQNTPTIKQAGQLKQVMTDPLSTELLMDILKELRKMNFHLSILSDTDNSNLEFIEEGI